jgi:hypothetical protein
LKTIEDLIGRSIEENILPAELGEAPVFREHKPGKKRNNNRRKFKNKKKKPDNKTA